MRMRTNPGPEKTKNRGGEALARPGYSFSVIAQGLTRHP